VDWPTDAALTNNYDCRNAASEAVLSCEPPGVDALTLISISLFSKCSRVKIETHCEAQSHLRNAAFLSSACGFSVHNPPRKEADPSFLALVNLRPFDEHFCHAQM